MRIHTHYKIIFSAVFLFILNGCTTLSTVKPLPAGSQIAIINNYDGAFFYVGTSNPIKNFKRDLYSKKLAAAKAIISPIHSVMIRRQLYRLTVITVPHQNPLTSLEAGSGILSSIQKSYLRRLLKGKKNTQNIQRVIILSKAHPFIANIHNIPYFEGYGYIEQSFFGKRRRLSFAAATQIAVINIHDMTVHSLRGVSLIEKTNPTLANPTTKSIKPMAIVKLHQWLHDKFAPKVVSKMIRMGLL